MQIDVGIMHLIASALQDGHSTVVMCGKRRIGFHSVLGIVFVKVETAYCKTDGAHGDGREQQFFKSGLNGFDSCNCGLFMIIPFVSVVGIYI